MSLKGRSECLGLYEDILWIQMYNTETCVYMSVFKESGPDNSHKAQVSLGKGI